MTIDETQGGEREALMELVKALEAVAPAVGDGKIISAHAYVLVRGGVLYATDGRQFASAPLDPGSVPGDFCVRYDALQRALSRDSARITVDDPGTVTVRYSPRGRLKLNQIPFDHFPAPPPETLVLRYPLPPFFRNLVADLSNFIGAPDAQIWTQGVHLGPDFCFAVNLQSGARRDWEANLPRMYALPPWAAKFIVAQDVGPAFLYESSQMLGLSWASGLALRTSYLSQDAPESAVTLMSNIGYAQDAVPEGLRESIERLKEHGATVGRIGAGLVAFRSSEVEIEEEVAVGGHAKQWNLGHLLTALKFAQRIDLQDTHAVWSGEHYRGTFAGMVG
jgi:hypothetical protein